MSSQQLTKSFKEIAETVESSGMASPSSGVFHSSNHSRVDLPFSRKKTENVDESTIDELARLFSKSLNIITPPDKLPIQVSSMSAKKDIKDFNKMSVAEQINSVRKSIPDGPSTSERLQKKLNDMKPKSSSLHDRLSESRQLAFENSQKESLSQRLNKKSPVESSMKLHLNLPSVSSPKKHLSPRTVDSLKKADSLREKLSQVSSPTSPTPYDYSSDELETSIDKLLKSFDEPIKRKSLTEIVDERKSQINSQRNSQINSQRKSFNEIVSNRASPNKSNDKTPRKSLSEMISNKISEHLSSPNKSSPNKSNNKTPRKSWDEMVANRSSLKSEKKMVFDRQVDSFPSKLNNDEVIYSGKSPEESIREALSRNSSPVKNNSFRETNSLSLKSSRASSPNRSLKEQLNNNRSTPSLIVKQSEFSSSPTSEMIRSLKEKREQRERLGFKSQELRELKESLKPTFNKAQESQEMKVTKKYGVKITKVLEKHGMTIVNTFSDKQNHVLYLDVVTKFGSELVIEIKQHDNSALYTSDGHIIEKHNAVEDHLSDKYINQQCSKLNTCGMFFKKDGGIHIAHNRDGELNRTSYIISNLETKEMKVADSVVALPVVPFEDLENEDTTAVDAAVRNAINDERHIFKTAEEHSYDELEQSYQNMIKFQKSYAAFVETYRESILKINNALPLIEEIIIRSEFEEKDDVKFAEYATKRKEMLNLKKAMINKANDLSKIVARASEASETIDNKLIEVKQKVEAF